MARSIIVTGGFGILGQAVAQAFAGAGDKVARIDLAAEAVAGAPDPAGCLDLGAIDLTDAAATAAALDQVVAAHGGIDVLVNIAGGFTWETLDGGNLATWAKMRAMNLTSNVTINPTRPAAAGQKHCRPHRQHRRWRGDQGGSGHGRLCRSEIRGSSLDRSTGRRNGEPGGDGQRGAAQHYQHPEQSRRYARCRSFDLGAAGGDCRCHPVPGVTRCTCDYRGVDPGHARRIASVRTTFARSCFAIHSPLIGGAFIGLP